MFHDIYVSRCHLRLVYPEAVTLLRILFPTGVFVDFTDTKRTGALRGQIHYFCMFGSTCWAMSLCCRFIVIKIGYCTKVYMRWQSLTYWRFTIVHQPAKFRWNCTVAMWIFCTFVNVCFMYHKEHISQIFLRICFLPCVQVTDRDFWVSKPPPLPHFPPPPVIETHQVVVPFLLMGKGYRKSWRGAL